MIPDHIITKALNAWIGDHNCPHPDQISIYRVLITRSLEAVAGEIWDQGCEAFEVAHKQDHIEPWEHLRDNPYRASET